MARSAHGFDADSLFQRDTSRDGETFASFMTTRQRPLDFWRRKLREASRAASRHAFDAASDREAALKHLQSMENHINTRGGTAEFDPAYMGRCFMSMLKAMGSEEEGAEDDEDDRTAEERHRAATGEDDVGETPARSATSTSSRSKPDHRKDFDSEKEGGPDRQAGADSALAFDAQELFQR